MRRHSLALFSGIGRRVALAVMLCGLLVVGLGLALQTGKQQRLYRGMHQQQLRQAAELATATIRSRLYTADAILRAISESGTPSLQQPSLRSRIAQSSLFDWRVVVPEAKSVIDQTALFWAESTNCDAYRKYLSAFLLSPFCI